jgi:hypothetical protein
MPTKVELKQLIESVDRGILPTDRDARFGFMPYSDTVGFHIYGEMNLTLKLTAAKETTDAEKLLKILQEYTMIAEGCASASSAVLLEVQGERIHLLLPAAAVDENSVSELLRFCMAFTNAVYSRIPKLAGKEFNGFKMAADHGRAILVASGVQANGSIISLGPAANAPAKEMKRNGQAEHLRMRTKHFAHVAMPASKAEWVDVQVRNPSAELVKYVSTDMNKKFEDTSAAFMNEIANRPTQVTFANADYMLTLGAGPISKAIKVQGFKLRADLDGFSKQVEAAFAKGEAGIVALLNRFALVMNYPREFQARIGRTIDMPWAGDCANVVILPTNSDYDDAREYLPVKAASEWHNQKAGVDSAKRKWLDHMGDAKWAIGIAGGDDKDGSNGYILIAPLTGRNRDFLVAAGWGVGRSLDAQESDGVAGDDTVMHDIDYAALSTSHSASFSVLNSLFWISHDLTPDSLLSSGISSVAQSSPIFVPRISTPVPQPRPHWHGNN